MVVLEDSFKITHINDTLLKLVNSVRLSTHRPFFLFCHPSTHRRRRRRDEEKKTESSTLGPKEGGVKKYLSHPSYFSRKGLKITRIEASKQAD